MATDDIRPIADWLVDGARPTMQAHEMLAELGERLVDCGIPLWRMPVLVLTLHPHIMGRRFVWRPGADIEVHNAPFDLLESAEFRGSPAAEVYASGMPIRRCLADADCPIEFPMLAELRDEWVTDYLASPLLFTDGEIHLATWTTRQPGGFRGSQIEAIESIVAPLARVAEVRALRRTARNLLDTYVGNTPASVFSPARFGGVTPKRSMRPSGCPICAASPCWRTVCLRRLWSSSSMTISIARFLRSSSMAEKFSNLWATGCWPSSRLETNASSLRC